MTGSSLVLTFFANDGFLCYFMYCGCQFWNGSQMEFFYSWPIFYWWLLISWVLVFIFNKITYAWLAMAERGRDGGREIENYLMEENFFREKVWGFFLRFCHFFPMECFLDQNYLSPTKESPGWKVYPTNTFSEDIDLCLYKPLRMTFH